MRFGTKVHIPCEFLARFLGGFSGKVVSCKDVTRKLCSHVHYQYFESKNFAATSVHFKNKSWMTIETGKVVSCKDVTRKLCSHVHYQYFESKNFAATSVHFKNKSWMTIENKPIRVSPLLKGIVRLPCNLTSSLTRHHKQKTQVQLPQHIAQEILHKFSSQIDEWKFNQGWIHCDGNSNACSGRE